MSEMLPVTDFFVLASAAYMLHKGMLGDNPFMIQPQPIATLRLRLRCAQGNDAGLLYQNCCGDPEASRYLRRGVHEDSARTARFLDHWCIGAWQNRTQRFAWVIADQADNRLRARQIVAHPPFIQM